MQLPYRRRVGSVRGFAVWIVDGGHIRTHIEREFTNFGVRHDFPFIPDDEFWIDEEFGETSEARFFIERMLQYRALLARGAEDAWQRSSIREMALRRRSPLYLDHHGLGTHELLQRVRKHRLDTYSKGVDVWVVNGALVRTFMRIDFTQGGHDKVYAFVPGNEVWIDDALDPAELPYVLLHELYERNLMSDGMTYEEAHPLASALEFSCRNGRDVHKLIARELRKSRTLVAARQPAHRLVGLE